MCKARLHTRDNQVIKPTFIGEIHSSHNHGSDPVRIDMLKGYNALKQHSLNSEESTRVILSSGIATMSSSTIAKLPKLSSVKRTIRNYKSVSDVNCGNPTCAAEIQIPEQYKVTLEDEPFLLYDSGYGDYNRIIVFSNPRFFQFSKNLATGMLTEHLRYVNVSRFS